ncbi:hypothetical protein RFI_06763 [Reticulomyxa filosa]|uniref:Viral A-type inclusion protein n=1 Tax=Reticulomyxa filosa TaxID=46433 RepID=X6NYJ4_RETFI|nr:hypothetical protein RFI_06763 [Reticulomyxa filosa]|eukprot:ETO30357.1 hypothetical protein RFI_06763 [Reticulomyxa filosa]
MTAREDSLSPLAAPQQNVNGWIDSLDADNQNGQTDEPKEVEDQDDEFSDEIDESWRNVLNDPDKLASELAPFLESLTKQNRELKHDNSILKKNCVNQEQHIRVQLLHYITRCLRNCLTSKRSMKMTFRLYVDDGLKKISSLERKVEAYEKVDRSDDINKTLQEFIERQEQYAQQIDELKQSNKQLENELKIEKLKTENTDQERRKSVTMLHNRMFQKLLDAEESNEEKMNILKRRVQELEKELRQSGDHRLSTASDIKFDRAPGDDVDGKNLQQLNKDLKQKIKRLELENSTLRQNISGLEVSPVRRSFLLGVFKKKKKKKKQKKIEMKLYIQDR